MNRQLALLGIVLHKDLRLFWHFAALVFLFLALSQIPGLVALLGQPLGALLQLLIPLATLLLIMVVCHEDSVVSVKHDWLTRPIPGPILLLAKSLFLLAAIVVPLILGGIANNLYIGRPVSEAVLAGASSNHPGGTLTVIVLVMALAAVTTGVLQAIIVLLSGFVALALFSGLATMAGPGVQTWASGSGWVLEYAVQITTLVVAASILWVQYRHRYTKAARMSIAVALIVGMTLFASATWSGVFAVQKMFSPEPSAAALVQVQVAKGCFSAAVLQPDGSGTRAAAAAGIVPALFSPEQRRRAGAGAIAFMTRLVRTNIPAGDLLTVGQATVTYRIAGATITPAHAEPAPLRAQLQWKTTSDGTLVADDYWLLSRNEFDRLAAAHDVATQIDYSLSLTAPVAQARFPADGRRASYPGIGYCSATLERAAGVVDVDCFKAGIQPAQLLAKLEGAPAAESKASGVPDFTPAVLNFLAGERHTMQLHATGSGVPLVGVTAYRARTHFDRVLLVPGILGGTVVECPAPK